MVFSDLASKPVATIFFDLASKSVSWVFWFAPQNRQLRFGDLALKITVMISWFGPQNHTDFGLSVVSQNRRSEDDVGHASRSDDLVHLEVSHARVSQFGLKTGGDATASGAYDTIMEVASGSS
jgi:hypothetical protein